MPGAATVAGSASVGPLIAVCILGMAPFTRAHTQPRLPNLPVAPVVMLGDESEDVARLRQLRTGATPGWLMRSPSVLTPRLGTLPGSASNVRICALRWAIVPPSASITWNSRLPWVRNDGGVWAGRGFTVDVGAGARLQCGRVSLHAVPALWYTTNAHFPILGSTNPERSGFANPFYSSAQGSADLPLRFGTDPLLVMEPGQSSIEVDGGPVVVGIGTESQWWGPGIRNALVVSSHAAGIPNLYVRTSVPVRTPLGLVEARWMVGALSESPFFDVNPANDLRSISGLIVAIRPAPDTNLALGAARVVLAPIPGIGALPARFFDAVARIGEGVDVRKATAGRAAEQITALFVRWVEPSSGVEAYLEWARLVLPSSLRALLATPQATQGYTIGLHWLGRVDARGNAWRALTEFTMLEQPVVFRGDPPQSFYASAVVPQGYTHRGQSLGASIGPGSSSQFLGVDRILGDRRAGAFVGRIRWQNDAFYRQPSGFDRHAHDVSLFAGLRGGLPTRAGHLGMELVFEKRLNYLFQNVFVGYGEDHTFDVRNLSLRLTLSPLPAGERRR